MSEDEYVETIKSGRPYFGSHLAANQGAFRILENDMRNLLAGHSAGKTGYKLLEIGAWAGQSTRMWAETLKGIGKVYTIDHFKAAENSGDEMKEAARTGEIRELYFHNIKGVDNIVTLVGSSDEILEILKPDFDFIYIDGDHAYTQFRKDLETSLKLLKPDGIICGDDLEVHASPPDIEYAAENKERDFIYDPITNRGYHPGIYLGIKDVLEEVNQAQHFWWKKVSEISPLTI